ncbi:OTU domain-containing 3 [Quillaja saponaria]|uniref:OTU domain-containing 3 n=1 Tax=Quillaja saponaria TaxID=32244 RepID=A0AAD7P6V9_QUISA|nr:OTU domain-containing 3 [Quillaja saponaria]
MEGCIFNFVLFPPCKHPKNSNISRSRGNKIDVSQLRGQLDALGVRITEVTSDGNCFFRALADQLEGNEEEHQKYRSMVVQHISEKREMFEPFIEDEVPFDEYCQSMEKDGTWAGHMELQAASLVLHTNICIHRNMSPRWYIRNFNDCRAHMIHLSYHDGEHYNSVRLKEDPSDGPARPIVIKADADLSVTSQQAKVASKSYQRSDRELTINPGVIKLVMAGSGCENAEKVEEILQLVNGDVDAAIEFLIAEQETEECPEKSYSLHCQENTSNGCDEIVNNEQQKEEPVEKTNKHDASNNSSKSTNDNSGLQASDKNIPRNKVCPCGSKKKYKACFSLTGDDVVSVTRQWTLERVEKKGNKEKKEFLMKGHWTWVHFVFDLRFEIIRFCCYRNRGTTTAITGT